MINNNNPSSRDGWAEAEADRRTDKSQRDVQYAVETYSLHLSRAQIAMWGKTEHSITFGSSIYFHNTS